MNFGVSCGRVKVPLARVGVGVELSIFWKELIVCKQLM